MRVTDVMKILKQFPLIIATTMTGPAQAAVTIYQDEVNFTADLADPANFGPAPANPHGNADLSGLAIQTTNFTINGNNYTFRFQEGSFDTSNGGTNSSATAAPTVADISVTGSNFIYEADNVSQGGGDGSAWGYDTNNTISTTSNTVALLDFTSSPTDVYSISMEAIDFEGGNAWSNVVAAYRANGTLIGEISFDWPAPNYGDSEVKFIGFGADEPIGYAAFFVGEDDPMGFGHNERIAVGDFQIGTSLLTSIPETSTTLLFLLGTVTLMRRKRS